MENAKQQLEYQVVQLKARLLDAKDSAERTGEVLGTVAKLVGYQGQDVEGLLTAVEALTKNTEVVDAD